MIVAPVAPFSGPRSIKTCPYKVDLSSRSRLVGYGARISQGRETNHMRDSSCSLKFTNRGVCVVRNNPAQTALGAMFLLEPLTVRTDGSPGATFLARSTPRGTLTARGGMIRTVVATGSYIRGYNRSLLSIYGRYCPPPTLTDLAYCFRSTDGYNSSQHCNEDIDSPGPDTAYRDDDP